MNYQIFNHSSTRTQRALQRTKTRFGRSVWYKPRSDFVTRMAKKFNMSDAQMRKELAEIHLHFRRQAGML